MTGNKLGKKVKEIAPRIGANKMKKEQKETQSTYYYKILLRFYHPSIDPIEITKQLNIEPDIHYKKGEQRISQNGTLLEETNKTSFWCAVYRTVDERLFFKEIEAMVEYFFMHNQTLFRKIEKEGGTSQIYVQLPGSKNIGDILKPKTLKTITDLNIELALEVFPYMKQNDELPTSELTQIPANDANAGVGSIDATSS